MRPIYERNIMTEKIRSQADQETIDKMKSDAKIVAWKLTKLAAIVTVGVIAYKKIKADLSTPIATAEITFIDEEN